MSKPIRMSLEACQEFVSEGGWGVCLACGAVECGEVEPDAEGYPCGDCGASSVMGLEQAVLVGVVVLS